MNNPVFNKQISQNLDIDKKNHYDGKSLRINILNQKPSICALILSCKQNNLWTFFFSLSALLQEVGSLC